MDVQLDIQLAIECEHFPDEKQLKIWILSALEHTNISLISPSLTLRVVSMEESEQLNSNYRDKSHATNVLSFPFEPPEGVDFSQSDTFLNEYLGDLVICAKLVEKEANNQLKLVESHWAHLIIHGTLHLLGFDHIEEDQANTMESLEIAILASCGFGNPYIIR